MQDSHPFEGDTSYGGFTNCTHEQLPNNETAILCDSGTIVERDRSSANLYVMLAFLLLLTVFPAVVSIICKLVMKDGPDMSSSASDGDTVVLEKEYEEDSLHSDDDDDGDEEAPTCSTHNSDGGSDADTANSGR